MHKYLVLAALFSFLVFAGCAAQQQPIQTYQCPTGEIVENVSKCPAASVGGEEKPCECGPAGMPEPEGCVTPPVLPENKTGESEQPKAPGCGNAVCEANETFGNCQQDCAPTYAYLYEYVEGLSYEYDSCDRIGSRVNCWTETTYVIRTEPYYTGESAKPYYSVYNSYTLRIVNDSGLEKRTVKKWVNKTSSECLLVYESVTPVYPISKFYNLSSAERFHKCPKIISVTYLGEEAVGVPLGNFSKAQKFRVEYVSDPDSVSGKHEYMLVWKVKGPLPSYMDYKFLVRENILVPLMTAREWTYINDQGIEIHVASNSTLKMYVEPLFG